jgi:hypothetical protein
MKIFKTKDLDLNRGLLIIDSSIKASLLQYYFIPLVKRHKFLLLNFIHC